MLDRLRKIGYFLCLLQGDQINLPDLAFIIILGKILFSSNVDWSALCVFGATVLNSIHARQVVNSSDVSNMTTQLQNLENVVDQIKAKI